MHPKNYIGKVYKILLNKLIYSKQFFLKYWYAYQFRYDLATSIQLLPVTIIIIYSTIVKVNSNDVTKDLNLLKNVTNSNIKR